MKHSNSSLDSRTTFVSWLPTSSEKPRRSIDCNLHTRGLNGVAVDLTQPVHSHERESARPITRCNVANIAAASDEVGTLWGEHSLRDVDRQEALPRGSAVFHA